MIPTTAEIRDQILADIQTALDAPEPLPVRSVWGILASAVAGALSLVYRFGAWVRRQIFTETMDAAALQLRGLEYGLTRTPATKWTGTITFTGAGTVPAGTLIDIDGAVYQTRSLQVVSSSLAIQAESIGFGADVNREVADVGEIVTPIAGIDRAVTVASVTQSALNAESDDDFRRRILFRQQNLPQGGAIPDWILWTLEVPGISEVKIDRPTAGNVTVYPLTDAPNPVNRIPDSTKLAEVLAYITDPRRSPIRAAAVNAVAPTEILFDVDISNLSPNTATVRAAIEEAITAHLYSRRPKQYSDEPSPRDVVSAARLSSIAVGAGAEVATVDLQNAGGSSITSYTLEINELAKLRDLTWA